MFIGTTDNNIRLFGVQNLNKGRFQQGCIQAKNDTGQPVWVPKKCPQKTKVANFLTT